MPLTDRQLLSQVQGLLLEARNGGAVWHSGLWTSEEVLGYLHDSQVELLRTTHALVSVALVGGDPLDPAIPLPVGTSVVDLPGDCLRVVRIGWLANDGLTPATPLTSSEVPEVELLQADLGYVDLSTDELSAAPLGHTVGEADSVVDARGDPNRLRLTHPTAEAGWLEVWYVAAPPAPDGTGLPLPVPDVLTPGLLWATVETMFRKLGRAEDQPGAAYAREMTEIATEATRILLRSGEA